MGVDPFIRDLIEGVELRPRPPPVKADRLLTQPIASRPVCGLGGP